MSRLNLIIADSDEVYLESLSNALINNYSKRFKINIFTNEEALIKFLDSSDFAVDILLISADLCTKIKNSDRINTLILLTGGRLPVGMQGQFAINRYQHIDMIVNEIIGYYSEKNRSEVFFTSEKGKSKVIGVYSPSGGSGKTSLSLCSSIYCAGKGLTVFYLNLENFNSSCPFFKKAGEHNLSKMIYYLKEDNLNITLKIEAIKCVDPVNKVHYFNPPDCSSELNELNPGEISRLIQALRKMDKYDVIFIDMRVGIDKNNKTLLELCDEVFLIYTQEYYSILKLKSFFTELEIFSQREKLSIKEKLRLILNKYLPNMPDRVGDSWNTGLECFSKIPYFNAIEEPNYSSDKLKFNLQFTECIQKLMEDVLRNEKTEL
jgi:cellulose biosynthesis protein BcsQ